MSRLSLSLSLAILLFLSVKHRGPQLAAQYVLLLVLLGEYVDQDSEDKLGELSQRLSADRFHEIRQKVLESSPGRTADVVIPLDQNFIGIHSSASPKCLQLYI